MERKKLTYSDLIGMKAVFDAAAIPKQTRQVRFLASLDHGTDKAQLVWVIEIYLNSDDFGVETRDGNILKVKKDRLTLPNLSDND